jgi:CheY-like chemotaxis protein
LNLCVNARDAIPNGGAIRFSTSLLTKEQVPQKFSPIEQDRYLTLEVVDSGTGMSEETAKRIFEPFFTTKEVGKGTGLGLAVLYGVVKSHGGFVDVQSTPGLGTTFTLYLPVTSAAAGKKMGTEESVEKIRGGSETILLIEDEMPLATIVIDLLREKGYRVYFAAEGKEAMETFAEHQAEIALVVSDIGLPKLSGIEVAKRIRETKPNLPLILASGYIDPGIRKEIEALSLSAVVQKPYDSAELLLKIREALDRT